MLHTIIIHLNYFTNVKICCFTQTVVSWALVTDSSNYKVLKNLTFLKIKTFLKTVQGAKSEKIARTKTSK